MKNNRSDLEILKASNEAGYVGGDYYNPIEELFRNSRAIQSSKINFLLESDKIELNNDSKPTYFIANLYKELKLLVNEGELLFAVYDKNAYKIAPFIYSEERLLDFEVQLLTGAIRRVGFFAIDEKFAKKGLSNDFAP